MLEERNVAADKIEILSDGSLRVRDATVIVRDGVIDPSYPPKYHRYVLHPGMDLTAKPDRVAAIANAVWTEDVVAAWAAAHPADGED